MKVILLFFCFMALSVKAIPRNGEKLIIDNDAGADDAMGIFIALLYEKYFQGSQVIALTTVNGNTNENNVFINDQKILNVAQRRDVPIYRGSQESLLITLPSDDFFGEDGFGNNNELFADPLPPQKLSAVEALIGYAKKYPNKINLVALGPLTNVALAIKLDPKFLERLNHLYLGGGNIYSKTYPNAEFNAQMDVEAYHIVAQHATPDKVTILPFSQLHAYLNISMDWRVNTLGGLDTDIIRAQNEYEKVILSGNAKVWDLLDPVVASIAVSDLGYGKHDIVTEYKYSKNNIVLCGEKRGINTNIFGKKEDANVRIAYVLDIKKYKAFLLDVFSAKHC